MADRKISFSTEPDTKSLQAEADTAASSMEQVHVKTKNTLKQTLENMKKTVNTVTQKVTAATKTIGKAFQTAFKKASTAVQGLNVFAKLPETLGKKMKGLMKTIGGRCCPPPSRLASPTSRSSLGPICRKTMHL